GDCRLQNAFYLNGFVHFVHMTDLGDGWNGINYCRLNVQTLTNESSNFGLKGSYDYSYPAVASFGKTINDKAVIIGFQRGSSDIYPEYRVVHCDNNMDWSSSKLVHIGENYVNLLAGDVERWGDYTGICRRNNGTNPRVWITGSYGADVNSQSTTNTYRSWIAEVYSFTTATKEIAPLSNSTRVFPNPVIDNFTYQFELNKEQEVEIALRDQYGKLIRTFYKGNLEEGKQELSFNKGNLINGAYYLQLKGKDNYEKTAKILISK
ncbi:MAG TPA: T9SS type A sorting domain-containing protein, partial [Saprospiraceae bacterium]|nr:T9SS type A sorting domain-containing protein [Saprospiraceae bacterium]